MIEKLNFNRKENSKVYNYYDAYNIVSLRIFKSGWNKPDLYHCLLEWGETGECEYKLYTLNEIKEKYNIDI